MKSLLENIIELIVLPVESLLRLFLLVGEVELLRCMHCGGFTEHLQDAVIWFSSGSTKSVLHYDAVDNINCVLDGKKEIFLVDKV